MLPSASLSLVAMSQNLVNPNFDAFHFLRVPTTLLGSSARRDILVLSLLGTFRRGSGRHWK